MTINLIDARRGLHNKCLELFADKNIAERIYRYLCNGIEDCEEAEPAKHGRWKNCANVYSDGDYECSECHKREWSDTDYCPNCGARMDAQIGEDKSHPFAESVMMGMDGGENGR